MLTHYSVTHPQCAIWAQMVTGIAHLVTTTLELLYVIALPKPPVVCYLSHYKAPSLPVTALLLSTLQEGHSRHWFTSVFILLNKNLPDLFEKTASYTVPTWQIIPFLRRNWILEILPKWPISDLNLFLSMGTIVLAKSMKNGAWSHVKSPSPPQLRNTTMPCTETWHTHSILPIVWDPMNFEWAWLSSWKWSCTLLPKGGIQSLLGRYELMMGIRESVVHGIVVKYCQTWHWTAPERQWKWSGIDRCLRGARTRILVLWI